MITENDLLSDKGKKKIEAAVITPMYGTAAQNAAIGAIYRLGMDNKVLREAAIQGLTNIQTIEGLGENIKISIAKYLCELNDRSKSDHC
jgi:hypothetical protein